MFTSLLLLMALSPGLFAWWLGRSQIRQENRPLLAERYAIYGRKVFYCFWLIILSLLLVVDEKNAIQTALPLDVLMPLAILSLFAGGFPCRKALLQESWGFGGFLTFQFRWFVVFQSFPLLLLFTPNWIVSAGENRLLTIAVLAVLIYGRLALNVGLVSKILGASLITDPHLLAGFKAINARSTATAPDCFNIPMHGGRMANAFALSALPKPAVLFTQTVLSELNSEEIDAIYAHELGHLEHRDAQFVRKYTLQCGLLATMALACAPLVETWFTVKADQQWLFFLVGFALLALHKRFRGHHQGEETHSDTRAVQLCGNPEVMRTALKRIHDINLVPHRWNQETEQKSTHPSLANRARSIQAVGGQAATPLVKPIILATAKTGSYVVFTEQWVHWLDGVPAGTDAQPESLIAHAAQRHAVAYSELVELWLKPAAQDQALLIGVDRQGKKHLRTLPAAMIDAAQTALAYSDQHLAPVLVQKPSRSPLLYLLTASMVACSYFAGLPYQLVGIMTLLYWLKPNRMLLATVGALALAVGIGHWLFDPVLALTGPKDLLAIAGALLGVLCAAYALWRHSRSPQDGHGFFVFTVACLGAIAVMGLAKLIAAGFVGGIFTLYDNALNNAATGMALLGLALACAIRFKDKPWLAGLSALMAASVFFIQSPYFGEQIARDPFAVQPSRFRQTTVNLTPMRAAIAEPDSDYLRLSPQAKRLAFIKLKLGKDGEYENPGQTPFTVVDFNMPPTTLAVFDIEFVDDDRLLALEAGEPDVLQLRRWQDGAWAIDKQWPLPQNFFADTVSWDKASQSWLLSGYDEDTKSTRRIFGTLDDDAFKTLIIPTKSYKNQTYSQYDLQDSALRVYRIKPDTAKPHFFDKYLDQRYIILSTYQNEAWSDKAQTSAHAISCLSNNLATTHLPCLYQRAGNQSLGIFNVKSGQLEQTVFLGRSDDYHFLGQQGNFILVGKNDDQLFAVNFQEKALYELRLPEAAKPIETLTWNGQYLALTSRKQGIQVFGMQLFED